MDTKLKAVRSGNRGAITKLLKKLEDFGDGSDVDKDEILAVFSAVEEKKKILKDLDNKIVDLMSEEEVVDEIQNTDEYTFDLDAKIRQLRKFTNPSKSLSHEHSTESQVFLNPHAENFMPTYRPTQTLAPPPVHTSSYLDRPQPAHTFRSSSSVSSDFHKLPKLNLPTFSGNILNWQSFWDSYESAVHCNISLSEVQKFNYLKSLLDGEASRTISGFSLTNSNYNKAIELLHERFGQTHKITHCYMQALLQIEAPRNTLASLRHYYDTIETYIRGLESLGQTQDAYGSLLVPVILNKLPGEICKNLARQHGSMDWLLSDLRRAIFSELNILEAGKCDELVDNLPATAAFHAHTKSKHASFQNHTQGNTHTNTSKHCAYCKGDHFATQCTQITDSIERWKIVKRDKLCFNCLGRHNVAKCKSKSNCKKCHKRHHTTLCNDRRETKLETSTTCTVETDKTHDTRTSNTSILHSSSNKTRQDNVLLKTAVAPVTYRGKTVEANILFDEGAQRSFVSRKLAENLKLKSTGTEKIVISGFGESDKNNRIQYLDTATVELQTITGSEISMDVLIVPEIAAPLRTYVHTAKMLPYLRNLRLAHPVTKNDAFEIEFLIGADQYWNIVEDDVIRGDGPTAVKSKLGYLLSGPANSLGNTTPSAHTSMMNVLVKHKIEEVDLEKFWKIETIGTETLECKSPDHEFHKEYENSSIRFHDNRYHVKLPWKEDHPPLPSNQNIAYKRTENVIYRLNKEPEMLKRYGQIIADQEQNGFIEKVTDDVPKDRKIHYIPHHPVKKDSVTTPIRIVYDCSCRATAETPSLNDCLLNIPPHLNDIAAILMRFRLHKFAVSTDIEKAFLNIGLEEEERDVTRFYWFDNPTDTNGKLVTYRFKSVLFGATCSPFILYAVLMKHLKNTPCAWTQRLTNDLYVDNIISSFDTEEELKNYYYQIRPLFSKAGFNLRSWGSNCDTLMNIADSDHVKDNSQVIKVLGMKWNVERDTIGFNYRDSHDYQKTITKREVLKKSSRIYDPLGLISPITVKNKMFMQELWKTKLDWDEPLPQELVNKWTEINHNTTLGTKIEQSRRYTSDYEITEGKTSLHVFTDASMLAYGACVYLVNGDESTLIMAKNRVAPQKGITIPKLELMGAVIGSRLLQFIQENIHIEFENVFMWTDSQIVLNWLKSTKPLPTFVKNRIQEINTKTRRCVIWNYCPTTSNPADLLSRGTDFKNFEHNQLWFNGPDWITDKTKWPVWKDIETRVLTNLVEQEIESETDSKSTRTNKDKETISKFIDAQRFNSFSKLLRVTAYVIRFIAICRNNSKETGPLTVNEINKSSMMWIKDVQIRKFQDIRECLQGHNQSKNCLVKQLKLYIDGANMIRCKGRIQNAPISENAKYPILLPHDAHVTKLIVLDAHQRSLHSGIGNTITLLRQTYWIPKIRQTIKAILRKCVVCRKVLGRPYQTPEPAPLPKDRLTEAPPFTITGVDFTGALKLRSKIGLESKAYICLFTCANTRAVHLETVFDLSEEQFILAFRRFASRKSLPKVMISDNCTTYVASSKEIEKLTTSKTLHETLNKHGTQWKFIPKRAPWYGGFWERLIGLTKNCIRKVLGRSLISMDLLITIVTEIEAILNDRPLTYISTDPLDEDPLTPSHLLYGRKITTLPYPNDSNIGMNSFKTLTHENVNRRYKEQNQIIEHFWCRWKHEYLTSLREFHKQSGTNYKSVNEGDVVQIHDDFSPRSSWKLGVIDELVYGNDGIVRSAKLRTSHGMTNRPIVKLYPLEICVDNSNININTSDRKSKTEAMSKIREWIK